MKRLLFLGLLLTACGNKNALTSDLAQQVILADKTAAQPVCQEISVAGTDRLPADYELSAEKDDFFKDFRTLEKYGYVKIDQREVTDPWGGGKQKAWHIETTPKWNTEFGSTNVCVATWKADKVLDFTPPAEVNGVQVSQVKVSGNQAYEGWAQNADLRKVLGMYAPLKPTVEKTYTLVLKDNGWQVAGVQ